MVMSRFEPRRHLEARPDREFKANSTENQGRYYFAMTVSGIGPMHARFKDRPHERFGDQPPPPTVSGINPTRVSGVGPTNVSAIGTRSVSGIGPTTFLGHHRMFGFELVPPANESPRIRMAAGKSFPSKSFVQGSRHK